MKTLHDVLALHGVVALCGVVLHKPLHLGLPGIRTGWVLKNLNVHFLKFVPRIRIQIMHRACRRAHANRRPTRGRVIRLISIQPIDRISRSS